jgi:hypothetical protein
VQYLDFCYFLLSIKRSDYSSIYLYWNCLERRRNNLMHVGNKDYIKKFEFLHGRKCYHWYIERIIGSVFRAWIISFLDVETGELCWLNLYLDIYFGIFPLRKHPRFPSSRTMILGYCAHIIYPSAIKLSERYFIGRIHWYNIFYLLTFGFTSFALNFYSKRTNLRCQGIKTPHS